MKPSLHLALASATLLVAAAFCAYELRRGHAIRATMSPPVRIPTMPVRAGNPTPAASHAFEPTEKPHRALSDRAKRIIEQAKRGPGGVPMVRPEALFADLPEVKRAFSKAAAAHQRLAYGPFIRTAGLSADEAQQFVEVLAQREATWGDIRVAATEQNLAPNDPIVVHLDEKNLTEAENRLRGILGPQRYEQLQQFRETLDARLGLIGLSALVTTSYATETPFTREQMDRLAALSTSNGVFAFGKAMSMPNGPPFDRVLAEAEKILTPAQMEVFGMLVDNWQISLTYSKIITERRH